MNYKINYETNNYDVVKSKTDEVLATSLLEAMRISIRKLILGKYDYEVLSGEGDNIFRDGNFLIRVKDGKGILCVLKATVAPVKCK